MNARALARSIKEGWSAKAKQKRDDHEPRIGSTFHAREAGGCQLRAYLRRLSYPETEPRPDAAGRLADLAERGEFLEQSTLAALKLSEPSVHAAGQKRGSATFSSGGIRIECVGRLDGQLSDDTGLECKSTGTEHFNEIRSKLDLEQLRPAWVDQCLAYCYIFNLACVYLILIDRNDHRYKVFEVKRDRKREEGLLKELVETEKSIQAKDPPNPKVTLACYHCPYHPYCPAFGGDSSSIEEAPSETILLSSSPAEV